MFGRVAEDDVGEFVEARLVGQLRERRDGNRSVACVALTVAIGQSERFLDDLQRRECSHLIPIPNRWRFDLLAVGLAQYEPVPSVDEPGEDLRLSVGRRVVGFALDGDWLAEREGLLALTVAKQIKDVDARARALSAVAKKLEPADREEALNDALAAVRRIGDEHVRATALSEVARHLPVKEREKALEELRAMQQSGRDRRNRDPSGPGDDEDEWGMGRLMSNGFGRLLSGTFRRADDDAVREESDSSFGVQLGPVVGDSRLMPEARQTALERELAQARRIEDELERATTLIALAAQVPEDRRRDVIREALETATRIRNDAKLKTGLYRIVGQLNTQDRDLLEKAVLAANRIEDIRARAETLILIAEQSGPNDREDCLARALTNVRRIEDQRARASALIRVATIMGKSELQEIILEEALLLTRQVDTERDRSRLLTKIARLLERENTRLADLVWLEAVRMVDPDDRVTVLNDVASIVSLRMLAGYSEQIHAVAQQSEARGVLQRIADNWIEVCEIRSTSPKRELATLLETLSVVSRPHLVEALTILIPAIKVASGDQALSEMAHSIRDVGRWWP
jgi:hypothetical protein